MNLESGNASTKVGINTSFNVFYKTKVLVKNHYKTCMRDVGR